MKERTNIGRDSYPSYTQNNESVVPFNVYLDIVYAFIKFIIDKIFKGFDVRLGARLGVIGIRSRKSVPKIEIGKDGKEYITGLAPNWRKTKEVWTEKANELGITFKEYIETVPKEERPKPVLCFNEHSNGLIYNIMWFKDTMNIVNKTYYSLRFSRDNKRRLSKMIMEGKAEFFETKPVARVNLSSKSTRSN